MSSLLEIDDEDGGYDNVYGTFSQQRNRQEYEVVSQSQNPYYGGDFEDYGVIQASDNPHLDGDPEWTVVQMTKNPYYGVDLDLLPGGQTLMANDNPYYDGDPNFEPESRTFQTSDHGLDVDAEFGDSNFDKKGKEKNRKFKEMLRM